MNNGAQGGQPTQGQPSGAQQQPQQQNRKIPLFRPEQMRNLPSQFTSQEKQKWEAGLKSLWSQIESNGEETPQHQDAKRKLFEFSKTLTAKIHNYRIAAQQAQAAQQGGQRPTNQPQPQQQRGEPSGGNPNPAPPQQQTQRPPISKKIMDHVNGFPYFMPPNLTAGTPEAAKWLQDVKGKYLNGLAAMEKATGRIGALDQILQKRVDEGKPFNENEDREWKEKKDQAQKHHTEAKNFVDSFRASQTAQRQAANPQQGNNGQQHQAGVNSNGQDAPARTQLIPQQQSNPALQNTQTVNAAIEAARNQQMGGGRPPVQQNGQMSQPPQMPNQNAPSHPNMSQHQGQNQGPHIKTEGGPPQINTAVNQIQNQHRGSIGNNSPQSAVPQSAGPPQSATSQVQGPPRALSHSAALNQAARSYSSGQPSGPSVMGHSHPSAPAREAQNVITNKMPIPKHLPERAAAPPQPVPMTGSRPTYSGGPSNSGNGVMSQPALTQTPPFDMHAEGERVLSKKKLDELVRQVTGGGQGLEGGETLTPEVEASIMNVADNFVDQVLQAACKNAKERGSKQLEIRDIQLTLERGYNIRIPGYASDEIRTVRKIQPSANWIAKMSAVQAAKVTGGKNAD